MCVNNFFFLLLISYSLDTQRTPQLFMVSKSLLLVGWLPLSFLKVLEWDYQGSWWRNLWKAMSSLAGGGLEATLVWQGCQWGEELGLEQHRTRTGWNSMASPCWPLTAFNHGSLEECLLSLPPSRYYANFFCGQLHSETALGRESGKCSSRLAKLTPQSSTLLFIFMSFLLTDPQNVLGTSMRKGWGERIWDPASKGEWGCPEKGVDLPLGTVPCTRYCIWNCVTYV